MDLSYVPLLALQRDIYRVPRGMERFHEYLRTMRNAQTGDLDLPLVAMNPMGKVHIPALIDELLGLNTDDVAARAVAEASTRLSAISGAFRVTLVVSDDAKGGWTNRTASEFGHCFENAAITKRGWTCGILWTSEQASAATARENVLTAVYRTAHALKNGQPGSLGEMMLQEGWAALTSGRTKPALDADDLAYSREVIAPLRDATQIACLFGDGAASSLGYAPRGLSNRAGFAVALADAREAVAVP
jgi:hypothetical protein